MAQSLLSRSGRSVALDEVVEGELRIDCRDGAVTVGPGEMFVVPKVEEHKPFAAGEVKLMLIESKGVVNTGDAGGEMTAENDVWV